MTATDSPLHITRHFKASRDRVFAAFATFELLSQWLGPEGCSVQGGSVDFREGGRYEFQLKSPNGDLVVSGQYREIVPPAKLVFTWQWQDDEDWVDLESVITVELEPRGEETELRLTQSGFPNSESREGHAHGWNGTFDKLAVLLSH